MAFLVDTTVIVDLGRRFPATWRWWSAQQPGDLYISTVSIGELYRGIHQRFSCDPGVLARELGDLAVKTLAPFLGRVLVFDRLAAETWGRLMGERAAIGAVPPGDDAKIAAIALCHGLTVATSNIRHLAPLCPTLDPRTA